MKRKFLIILIIIVVIVIAAGVYYYVISRNSTGPASIKLTYPRGGETFKIGSTYRIQWATENVQNSANIDVSITTDDSNVLSSISNKYISPDSTYFDWTVSPSIHGLELGGDNYRIVVTIFIPQTYAPGVHVMSILVPKAVADDRSGLLSIVAP